MKSYYRLSVLAVSLGMICCKPRGNPYILRVDVASRAYDLAQDRYDAYRGKVNALSAVDYQKHLTAFEEANANALSAGATESEVADSAKEGRDRFVDMERILTKGLTGAEKEHDALDVISKKEP